MPTLLDGREVPSDSPEWKAECRTIFKHVCAMRRMDRSGRNYYLNTVALCEGEEASRRVKAAFLRDWEVRHAETAKG